MTQLRVTPLATFEPAAKTRAWVSIPNPNGRPYIATATSDKSVLVYSLVDFRLHSSLEGGHERSVRSCAWKPAIRGAAVAREHTAAKDEDGGRQEEAMVIATGSFDATMGIWRRDESTTGKEARERGRIEEAAPPDPYEELEVEIGSDGKPKARSTDTAKTEKPNDDWDFVVVLEGHDSEIKTVAYSPSGQWLASCSRDKSIWIWEEIGAAGEDEFETVAVLQEHEADVKTVCWRADDGNGEVLASGSYDDTIRLWREDGDGEWESFATLEGHEGTVWSLAWEPEVSIAGEVVRPAGGGGARAADDDAGSMAAILRTPRLLSCGADARVKIWSQGEWAPPPNKPSYLNSIPNRMRRPVYETWTCAATLPAVHDLPVYAVAWSAHSGRVASAGGDGRVAVYAEVTQGRRVVDGEVEKEWIVLAVLSAAHGPFESNHVAWSRRFDQRGEGEAGGAAGAKGGPDEMLITTGDDGVVKAWAVNEQAEISST